MVPLLEDLGCVNLRIYNIKQKCPRVELLEFYSGAGNDLF